MAYTALTVTAAGAKTSASDGILSSSFIPAYPHTDSNTTFNEALYWERQQNCDKLNP